MPEIHSILSELANEADIVRRLYLATALTPYKGITYKDRKRELLAVEAVIREGLKVAPFP